MNADTPETSKSRQSDGIEKRTAAPKWLWFFHRINNLQWILGEVEATRQLIKRLAGQSDPGETAESDQVETEQVPWCKTATKLLDYTEKSVKSRERQRAWLSLKAAKRACLYGMNREEVLARSVALHKESEGIDSSWHQKAIQEALDLYGTPLSNTDLARLFDPNLESSNSELKEAWLESSKIWQNGRQFRSTRVDALAVASEIRDEYFDTFWRKVDRRVNAITTAMISLGIISLMIIVLLWAQDNSDWLTSWAKNCVGWLTKACGELQVTRDGEAKHSLVIIALFGALGASLSTAYSLVSSALPGKFAEGAMSIAVTASRPVIGAAAAIAIYFIFSSGLIKNVLEEGAINAATIYALAFTSGFTERLIFSATDTIVKKTQGSS